MLAVHDLEARYGESQVLFGIDLELGEGEVLTLLGRNGMGKSTTVKAIMGMIPPCGGRVVLDGEDVTGLAPHRIARRGIGLVPEGRQVFVNLTVRENLIATSREAGSTGWNESSIYALFPVLGERRHSLGKQLSGGEQQMLAIGRALMINPRLLILDEATEGLAPLIRREIWAVLARLKAEGQAILVIDKNVEALQALADRHAIIERGKIAWSGTSAELESRPELTERYLGV